MASHALNDMHVPTGDVAADTTDPTEREHLMWAFGIGFTGRYYEYAGYRYDRLADAVNYARLQRAMGLQAGALITVPSHNTVEEPDDSQRALMATLGITFGDGSYRLNHYRYERLEDAVDYARIKHAGPGRFRVS